MIARWYVKKLTAYDHIEDLIAEISHFFGKYKVKWYFVPKWKLHFDCNGKAFVKIYVKSTKGSR